MKTQLIIINHI